jgi:hypothetical protein
MRPVAAYRLTAIYEPFLIVTAALKVNFIRPKCLLNLRNFKITGR